MKEIIGLTIEDPYVRRILGDCKRACERLRGLTEDTNRDADIRKWGFEIPLCHRKRTGPRSLVQSDYWSLQ